MAKGKENILEQDVEMTLEQALVKIQELETANKELLTTIDDMQQVIEANQIEVKSAKAGKRVFSHNKLTLEVVIPSFRLDGKKYTADDLESNSTLVDELLKRKSGAIRIIETK